MTKFSTRLSVNVRTRSQAFANVALRLYTLGVAVLTCVVACECRHFVSRRDRDRGHPGTRCWQLLSLKPIRVAILVTAVTFVVCSSSVKSADSANAPRGPHPRNCRRFWTVMLAPNVICQMRQRSQEWAPSGQLSLHLERRYFA